MQTLKAFRGSIAVTVIVLALVGILTGSIALVVTAAVLAVLEVTLSFDNAVVNAKYLKKMSPLWQKLFLTVGILIAVFGMRLVFPIVIVAVTADLGMREVIDLALNDSETYAEELEQAQPAIYSFGGVFLLMIFLDWVFGEKDVQWLRPLELTLERFGKLGQLSVLVASLLIVIMASVAPSEDSSTILFSGLIGLVTYLFVSGLDTFFDQEADEADEQVPTSAVSNNGAPPGGGGPGLATYGKAGFSTFLYLEVLDASFSFDGVIGAFAISSNVLVIAAGLGIGAVFVRSMTVYLVRQGTLGEYRYLEHGAHWAIGALATILLIELKYHIPEAVTGLLGLGFILAAFTSSILANRKDRAEPPGEAGDEELDRQPAKV
ncbi:MAG: DUF475 domain-containing protein [Actinomycetota bacterium]|nr:DUF475 domain-containing protein [Actinomycetota bacterium]